VEMLRRASNCIDCDVGEREARDCAASIAALLREIEE
jgi:hypothetical protein